VKRFASTAAGIFAELGGHYGRAELSAENDFDYA
jgi:hypothetical protein